MKSLIPPVKTGAISHKVLMIAKSEKQDPGDLNKRIARGSVIFMSRGNQVLGIGEGLKTKVNVNIGTSSGRCNPDEEIKKAIIAEKYGADTLSDLSTAGDIKEIRKNILKATSLPLTTVPIYQAVAEHSLDSLSEDKIMNNLKNQATEGISCFVLHCVSSKILKSMKKESRILGVVSKGGSMMASYMIINGVENPYLTHFDKILKILKSKDIVLSLGNTMRSGCIHDFRDKAQLFEIEENIRLAQRAHKKGVQVIIEGAGGHIRADKISKSVQYYKKRTKFPLFVAGPLPADIGMGYDHITGSIGATLASGAGADYLCYITRAEHKGLPTPEQVREGLISFRIAAHIGDSIKFGLNSRDKLLAEKRAEMNWKEQISLALDPVEAGVGISENNECTMCGSFCAIKMMNQYFGN